MEHITILNEKENLLFNRKEVKLNIKLNVNPKITEAEELVAKKFSSKAENVKIKNVNGRFGSNEFIITANIYNSKEDKDNVEPSSQKGTAQSVQEAKKEQ